MPSLGLEHGVTHWPFILTCPACGHGIPVRGIGQSEPSGLYSDLTGGTATCLVSLQMQISAPGPEVAAAVVLGGHAQEYINVLSPKYGTGVFFSISGLGQ